jgi:plasmid stability protein
MTTLTVRNVDQNLKERLRIRAAHNGRSMEAEPRQILHDVLTGDRDRETNLAKAIRRRLAPLSWSRIRSSRSASHRRSTDDCA